jgi:hypothetical protein
MITGNILHRVFRIGWADGCGTAFSIDVDGKEYLVTAAHVVDGLPDDGEIEIFSRGSFVPLRVRVVGRSAKHLDTAVLAAERALAVPNLPAEPSADGIVYGQDVYFLGFPYELPSKLTLTGDAYPLPYVKKAIVSQLDMETYILDGHNNPGFSGGPVVFVPPPGGAPFKVAGIISGYRFEPEPIYRGDDVTELTVRYNTGLIVATSIDAALNLIKANPIGFTR